MKKLLTKLRIINKDKGTVSPQGILIGIFVFIGFAISFPILAQAALSSAETMDFNRAWGWAQNNGYVMAGASGLTAGRVPFVDSDGSLTDESGFEYDVDTNILNAEYFSGNGLLNSDLSADGDFSSNDLFEGTAGDDLTFGEVVYFSSADSKWELSKGDAESTLKPWTATVVVTASENATVTLTRKGFIREDDWNWSTPGAPLYVSASTAGAMTESTLGSGEFLKIVAYVKSADVIYVEHSTEWLEIE